MTTTFYERDLLMEGVIESVGSGKELARRLGLSPSMVSKIGSGERSIADDLKPKISSLSMKAAIAIIIESTGFRKLFGMFAKDKHPQSLLRSIKKEDIEADAAIDRIADRLIDKPANDDLTEEDVEAIRPELKELVDRIQAEISFLAETDGRYPKLRIKDLCTEKEKDPEGPKVKISYSV